MSDIFLSYKHVQGQEARQLVSALSARGWTVWWDWNIPAGSDWQAQLDAQLDAAGCVVVLWSAASIQSEWVLYEARFAQRTGKLVQVLLEPVDVPAEFAVLHAVNLIGWTYEAAFHAGFDRLRAAIREPLQRRSLPNAFRSGTLVRIPGAAGDVLGHDTAPIASSPARPAPVMLLPPPFRNLLDRTDACDAISAALAQRSNVALAGEAGSGKTALLSYVGNLDQTTLFHDGVVYLQAATLGEDDLAQMLHEAFYDVAPGARPSTIDIRRRLADRCALLLIDDVAVPPAAIGTLNACAPDAVWVFASQAMLASAQRRPVALKGLPADAGIALFERTLSRPLRGDERALVAQIVDAVQGHPARIEQAAGTAVTRGVPAAVAELGIVPSVENEDKRNRYVLAALACAGDVGFDVEQCAGIALVDSVPVALADLERRGLVQHDLSGFRLAAGVAPSVATTTEFAECRDRATTFFTRFAIASRETPRRVARFAAPMMASMTWAAEHGHSADALRLARTIDGPLADSNRWDAWRAMLACAHDIAVTAGDTATAGWALHQQGTRAVLLGDRGAGRRLLGQARSVRQRSGDSAGLQATRHNLKFLGWARWVVVLAVLAGCGLTTLVAVSAVTHALPESLAQLMKTIPGVRNLVLPDIAIDPPQGLAFARQDVGSSAQQLPLRIDNKGLVAAEVIDVTIQGSDAASFAVGNSCDGIRIPRSLACRLFVQFMPDKAGTLEATIAIRVRDAAAPYRVPVSGTGNAMPIAQLSPLSIDFGEVEIGADGESRSVTLRNTGSAPLAVAAIDVDGDSEFRVAGETCRASAVAPGEQCTIELHFSPQDTRAKRASLIIHDGASGSPRTVELSGTGHATPRLQVAPASVDFGQLEVGKQDTRQVRVRNAGNVAIDIDQVVLSGSNAFRVQGTCAKVKLAPGATCALALRFVPTTTDASRGKLEIRDAAGDVLSVELSGTGSGRPVISVTPAQLAFGTLTRGADVKPRRIAIASVGTAALLLDPPTIDGDRRFSLVNHCPARLDPNAQCSVDVGFDASGSASAVARVVVKHNATGGAAVVALVAGIAATPAPVIDRFTSSASSLQRRDSVQLCFSVRNAQQLRIDPDGPQPQSATTGCVVRLVDATTTFRLTATGAQGPSQQTSAAVKVAVAPAAPPPLLPVIVYFRAEPADLQRPGATRLCYATQNAARIDIAPGAPQPVSPVGACVSRRVGETTTFTLTVANRAGQMQTASTTVRVAPQSDIQKPPAHDPHTTPARTSKEATGKGVDVVVKDSAENPSRVDPLLGWCCRLGTVTRALAANCARPAQWFAVEAAASQACAPVVK